MPWLPKKTVVVPVDFSDESFTALSTALELVENASAIHAVYVLPILDPAEPGVIWTTIDNDVREKHARDALAERLKHERFRGLQIVILFGDPGSEIAHYAQEKKADLIVVPSHGRTGLKRLLIGSVAEKVTRLAHCPVLVLRT